MRDKKYLVLGAVICALVLTIILLVVVITGNLSYKRSLIEEEKVSEYLEAISTTESVTESSSMELSKEELAELLVEASEFKNIISDYIVEYDSGVITISSGATTYRGEISNSGVIISNLIEVEEVIKTISPEEETKEVIWNNTDLEYYSIIQLFEFLCSVSEYNVDDFEITNAYYSDEELVTFECKSKVDGLTYAGSVFEEYMYKDLLHLVE